MFDVDLRDTFAFDERLSRLAALISSVDRPGDYFASGRLLTPMPRIAVVDAGVLSFPVPAAQREALIAIAGPAPYPPVAALDIPHASISVSAGEWIRGAVHIQTVNSRLSQIKRFLRKWRGIATRYLDSYLRLFHLNEMDDQPSPKAYFEAAMTRLCLRCVN